jgi:hypothetical protein
MPIRMSSSAIWRRSEILDLIELAGGYGVEMGLLIDVWQR